MTWCVSSAPILFLGGGCGLRWLCWKCETSRTHYTSPRWRTDESVDMQYPWSDKLRGNRRTQTTIRLRATFYVTNTSWNPLGSNCVLRSEKPPTNRLNYSRVSRFQILSFCGPNNQSIYKATTSHAQKKNPIVISSKGLEPNQNKIGSVWWTFLHLLGTFYRYRHLGPEAFVVRSFDLEWRVTQNCILYTHPAYSPVASNFTIPSATTNAFLSFFLFPTLLSYLHRLYSVV
jgi:hypothetical protein